MSRFNITVSGGFDRVAGSSGGASFFEWGGQFAKGGDKTFLGGQVYMIVNNALPQCGTHITPLFQVPPLSFSLDLFFLFASCGSFPFRLSFTPISRPSPIGLRVPCLTVDTWFQSGTVSRTQH